jgi:phenylpyruvate tautomerase PptA (4-oxalocrotonate tautomerase family)
MPFANIRIVEGHPGSAKTRSRAVSSRRDQRGETQLPREAVWVTFEDVKATDWYVAEKSVTAQRQGRT